MGSFLRELEKENTESNDIIGKTKVSYEICRWRFIVSYRK